MIIKNDQEISAMFKVRCAPNSYDSEQSVCIRSAENMCVHTGPKSKSHSDGSEVGHRCRCESSKPHISIFHGMNEEDGEI